VDLQKEIAKQAYELYVKGGRLEGNDLDNWLEAEKIMTQQNKKKTKVIAKSSMQSVKKG